MDTLADSFYFTAMADPDITEENYISFWFGLDMTNIEPEKAVALTAENDEEHYITGILCKYDEEHEQRVKATPHKDHFLDFAHVLLASFPSYCTIRPSKATALRRPRCTI